MLHFTPVISKKLSSNSTSPSSFFKGSYLHGVIYRRNKKRATAECLLSQEKCISSNYYRDKVTI